MSRTVEDYTTTTKIGEILGDIGIISPVPIAKTLQGSVWRAFQPSNNRSVVIKVANKGLAARSLARIGSNLVPVQEDILKESKLLKYLTRKADFPDSITKYYNLYQSKDHYYLLLEDAGQSSLFDFVVDAHRLICSGHLKIASWHQLIRVVLKQVAEALHFLHHHHIAFYDLSLENIVICDVPVEIIEPTEHNPNEEIRFLLTGVQIKLCDFGLADTVQGKKSLSQKWCGKTNYKSPEVTAKKKGFNAKANDIWCLGVCLLMMMTGSRGWQRASASDPSFMSIWEGKLSQVLKERNLDYYIDRQCIGLLERIFQREEDRIGLEEILNLPICS